MKYECYNCGKKFKAQIATLAYRETIDNYLEGN